MSLDHNLEENFMSGNALDSRIPVSEFWRMPGFTWDSQPLWQPPWALQPHLHLPHARLRPVLRRPLSDAPGRLRVAQGGGEIIFTNPIHG